MKRFIPIIALSALTAFKAHALEVMTTLKPLQMIAHELVLEHQTTSTLLSSTASPHDYALKPSDIQRINDAELVVWVGPDLETFLSKPLKGKENVLRISDIEGIPLREVGERKCSCGSVHAAYDPHVWLGPEQALHIARAITQRLVEIDPHSERHYERRLALFEMNLEHSIDEISVYLKPIKDKGYYVFHDAYAYYEDYFGLTNQGYFTINPERGIGAKRLNEIRKTLNDGAVQCVFTEPQFQPAVVKSVVRGTTTKIGELDPLGTHIEVCNKSYFEFLASISTSLTDCLGK